MRKIVGTAAPLRALKSRGSERSEEPHGTFATALPFIEWLERTGQRAWQLLPISETHLEPGSTAIHVPSPYKGYGVGLDPAYLVGWPEETPDDEALRRFRLKHADWLPEYALFCAIRDGIGTDRWTDWPEKLRDREPETIRAWHEAHAGEVRHHEILQWRAHQAFAAIRERAKTSNIMIIGDLPFYLPAASPLVWAHRACFDLGIDGHPLRVSGVPDSPKAHYGRQVWGHPLYRWSDGGAMQEAMRVWEIRLEYHAGLYDLMRLDHAKGLFRFGAIDPVDPKNDAIMTGPGSPALEEIVLHARRAGLELFAEDSGDWLDELRATLLRLHVPGIRILRYAYDERRKSIEAEYAAVAEYPEDCVAFTTTHDTVTLIGFVRLLDETEKRHLCTHVGIVYDADEAMLVARLRGALLASPAHIRIVPIQDWLLSEERINIPGTERPVGDMNWRYRLSVPVEDLPIGPL